MSKVDRFLVYDLFAKYQHKGCTLIFWGLVVSFKRTYHQLVIIICDNHGNTPDQNFIISIKIFLFLETKYSHILDLGSNVFIFQLVHAQKLQLLLIGLWQVRYPYKTAVFSTN